MKKLFAAVIALVMVCALSVSAFAAIDGSVDLVLCTQDNVSWQTAIA